MKYTPGQLLVLKKSEPRTYRVVRQIPNGYVLEYWENDSPESITKFEATLTQVERYLLPLTKLGRILS